ncbi:H-NS histone family protein [Ralstonia pseudosolanacearum]|uniref:H-NS histone family protein n=1 Tax=Ralstonia pseudosolanacearum TaxID=1310165 RepID=UPI001FFA8E7D|nr:H-NS family nucleoid-associated regulatory protein [Ralstonia pseudosolanacearum]
MKEGQQPDPDREAAIDWIQEQMETYGLTVEDLQALGCFTPPPKPAAPVYMNAAGQVWDGTGTMPDWLQRAVNAGQSIEHFRVN